MKLPKIIGIAGTNGAGKDTLGELLAERCGYKFVSVSDILREELTKQNIPHDREKLGQLSTKWAREHGPGVLSVKTIESYVAIEKAEGYKGLVIGSIRRPAEAHAIQDEGGCVLWVDADRQTRYRRLQSNARGRITDILSFEDWSAEEDREMHPQSDDPTVLNMSATRDVCDKIVMNNFATQSEYREYLIKEFEL
jgi:dephospho-CoA kinase